MQPWLEIIGIVILAGIICIFRCFDSISELKGNCPVIAVIKFSFLIDHYVTVLNVTDDKVMIGDPIGGKKQWSYEDFKKRCWPTAIILKCVPNHE